MRFTVDKQKMDEPNRCCHVFIDTTGDIVNETSSNHGREGQEQDREESRIRGPAQGISRKFSKCSNLCTPRARLYAGRAGPRWDSRVEDVHYKKDEALFESRQYDKILTDTRSGISDRTAKRAARLAVRAVRHYGRSTSRRSEHLRTSQKGQPHGLTPSLARQARAPAGIASGGSGRLGRCQRVWFPGFSGSCPQTCRGSIPRPSTIVIKQTEKNHAQA